MKFMGKQERRVVVAHGVARAAVAGATRHELIQEAVRFLLAGAKVDRVGVWMESACTERVAVRGFARFRGVVADRDGQTTPSEWERLSPEAPLPVELLDDGKSVEQDLNGAPDQLILGVLVELRRAVWVPIEIGGRLCGVLLAGVRKRHGVLPVKLLESVSVELALAMELDEERRRAQRRQTDITSAMQFLENLARSGPTDAVLTQLVESCTDAGIEGEGLSAAFAVLRARDEEAGIPMSETSHEKINVRAHRTESPLDLSWGANERGALSWRSGDTAWLRALDSQPLAHIWQRAWEAHSTVAVRAGVGTTWPRGDVSRVVAISLQAAGESVGVLVAGFRNEYSPQTAIERLESRAGLATTALVLRERNGESTDDRVCQIAGVQAGGASLSRGARELGCSLDTGAREEIQRLHPVSRVIERATRPVLKADRQWIGREEIHRDLTVQRALQSKALHTEKLAALGQMVTGVAHELSNPLTSILGYAQRLFLRSQVEGPSDEVRQIFQEAERASTIVRRLLMSARESRPERRRVSLNEVVSRTMDLQKIRLASQQVTVELNLDETLPLVLGDGGQLQQVLMNLIGNASQAIEQRGQGGIIRLNTKSIDSGRNAQLEVSDDGPGIPPAIASRIFDPFFTTKPVGVGTGLGLAIVLGVVREHGGEVRVVSPPGSGATFTLQFPAALVEQVRTPAGLETRHDGLNADVALARVTPSAALRSLLTGSAAPVLKTTTRVLVVEGEPTVARLISDVLEDEGFQVEALLDGYKALERAARASYDLVICDMKMPGLDGQHFYETLACMGNPLSKRFLFVTGDVLSAHTQEFLERYQLPHVAKPFRVEELTEKVRGLLSEVQPNQPSGELPVRTIAART